MSEGLVLLHYCNVFALYTALILLLKVEHAILDQLLTLILRSIISIRSCSGHILRITVEELLVVERVFAQVPNLRTLLRVLNVVVLLGTRQDRPVGYVWNANHAITGQALDSSRLPRCDVIEAASSGSCIATAPNQNACTLLLID